ncbi:Uncharacterized protein dnm_056470 [Desulfonema magnum]|uniref:Uncharacterized protein n=1 Tax=Desulfonema magnum TaxID=45655 RepID=A0A975GQ21_9BACT|nr:Uncharacterized protein dnm_056470 [Desulfonema magnum]
MFPIISVKYSEMLKTPKVLPGLKIIYPGNYSEVILTSGP